MSDSTTLVDERELLLETLLGVATALACPRPLQDNLDETLSIVVDVLGLDRGVLRAPRPDGALVLLAEAGPAAAQHPPTPVIKPGDSLDSLAYTERQAFVENDHKPGGRTGRKIPGVALRSTAAFPVLYMDDCLGTLHFGSVTEGFFTDSRVTFLSAIAGGYGALLYNAKLRDSMERQLRLASDRSEFIEIASHELRTPIAVISGYTELMINSGSFPDKELNWLAQTHKEAARLARIVDDLVALEWMRSGDEQGRADEFSLRYLLDEIKGSIATDWPQAELPIDRPEDGTIIGDLRRLVRIVSAVVDNALRHSGASSARLSASFDPERKYCKIVVVDKGHGFPEGFAAADIGIFSRPDYSNTSNIRGLGLGLFVVKTFLDSIGGTLSISSSESGATVAMYFPAMMTAT